MAKKNDTTTAEPTTAITAPDAAGTDLATTDYGDYAGGGFENVTMADTATPFLSLLQAMSPQVAERKGHAGDWYNTVTGEVYTAGVLIVPACTVHQVIEWKPRDSGGGFVAAHKPDDAIVKEAEARCKFGEWQTPDGNDLVDTRYLYAVLVGADPGSVFGPIVIPFTSTKIKEFRQWMGAVRTLQVPGPNGRRQVPPLFAHLTKLTSKPQKHAAGSSFNVEFGTPSGNRIKDLLPPTDARFQAAHEFCKAVLGGSIETKHEQAPRTAAAGGDAEAPF